MQKVGLDSLEFFVIGVNFHSLALEHREKLTRFGDDFALLDICNLSASVVLSTCNRFEVFVANIVELERVENFFRSECDFLPANTIFVRRGLEAVRHLFRVVSALDSMVIGETQIAHQVKEAYLGAIKRGGGSKLLHHLFQFSFSLSKRIKRVTGLGNQGLSVSYVAIQLARQIFADFSQMEALLIGSGQMAELCLLHLQASGCRSITIANRTLKRAEELAIRFKGRVVQLDDVPDLLSKVDLIVGSIRTEAPLLLKAHFKGVRKTPLFLVDLGVPRNFSIELSDLENIYLYDMDHLAAFVANNQAEREDLAREAEMIIEYGMHEFNSWLYKLNHEPHLLSARALVRQVISDELRNIYGTCIENEKFDLLVHRISQKINHGISNLFLSDASTHHPHQRAQDLLELYFDDFLEIGRSLND